jgi:hypothetical protein
MNGFIVKSYGRLSANCDQLSSAAVVAEPKITVEMLPRKMRRQQTLGHIWSELKLLFFRRPSVFLPKPRFARSTILIGSSRVRRKIRSAFGDDDRGNPR